jgi:hypothetical protein
MLASGTQRHLLDTLPFKAFAATAAFLAQADLRDRVSSA